MKTPSVFWSASLLRRKVGFKQMLAVMSLTSEWSEPLHLLWLYRETGEHSVTTVRHTQPKTWLHHCKLRLSSSYLHLRLVADVRNGDMEGEVNHSDFNLPTANTAKWFNRKYCLIGESLVFSSCTFRLFIAVINVSNLSSHITKWCMCM